MTNAKKSDKLHTVNKGDDGTSTASIPSQRAVGRWKDGDGRAGKTLPSLRKSPFGEVEPHGTPRYGEMKRAALAVNLGGIAEDVFRPMGGRGIFFVFRIPKTDFVKNILSIQRRNDHVKNAYL